MTSSNQPFVTETSCQEIPSESQQQILVNPPFATGSSNAMSFLSELSNIDWVSHGWNTQEELQHLIQNCSSNNGNHVADNIPLVNGDTFFSPLFEGDLLHLQTNIPVLQHATLLESHVNPSIALQPYPPSPSSSGAETDHTSRAASTASPSPHLVSVSNLQEHSSCDNMNGNLYEMANDYQKRHNDICATSNNGNNNDGIASIAVSQNMQSRRKHKRDESNISSQKMKRSMTGNEHSPDIKHELNIPSITVTSLPATNSSKPLITPTSMPTTLFTSIPSHSAGAPSSPADTQPVTYTTTPTALSNDSSSPVTNVVTAAANQLLTAGLPPALAQLVASGISPNYSSNPAIWAAAAAAAAAAALLPTVSAPTSSGAIPPANPVTTNVSGSDVTPLPISPSPISSGVQLASVPASVKAAPLDSTGAPKVAITRLPPRSNASTSSAAPPSPPPAPVNPTTRQRKKSAHNAIERRYRTNLNDRIAELRAVVPALSHLSPDEATTAARKSTQDGGADEDDHTCIVDGVAAATRLNKATILRKATEYIVYLRNNNQTLRNEQDELRNLLLQLPGGAQSLAQWEANRATNGNANSPINGNALLSISEPLADEVNSTVSSISSTEANSSNSNNVSRTLLAAFAGLCLIYSPSGTLQDTNLSMAANNGDDHSHAFGALSALPGATTLMHGVNSVASAVPHAMFGWILRFTGLFIFVWLLGLMSSMLRSTSVIRAETTTSTNGKTTTHRRTMSVSALRNDCINKLLSDLQQRSTISLIISSLREIVALGTRLGIGVTWPMSVPSAAQGLSVIAASEAEITALRLVCEQSVVGIEQVGHYSLLATLYAALRLANHSALPSSAPGFGKHTCDPNNAIAIAVAIQSRVPIRLLSDWIVTKHWEHAQRTVAATAAPVIATNTNIGRAGRDDLDDDDDDDDDDDALWALRNPSVTRFLKQGGWVGMSLSSLANSPSDESDDSQLHSEEDEIRPVSTRLPALNTALARLELPCLLAHLDQLYRLLVTNLTLKSTGATLTLQFLGIFARLERYAVLAVRRHHEFGQAVMQACWLAICGASIAAFRLGQHAVLERCVQGMNQLRANSKTIDNDKSFRHVWLTICAVYALSANDIRAAYHLNHVAAQFAVNTTDKHAKHSNITANYNCHDDNEEEEDTKQEHFDKPHVMMQQIIKHASYLAHELQAHVYLILYQQLSTQHQQSTKLLRIIRKRALTSLAITRRQCIQLIGSPTIISDRITRYQLATHILISKDLVSSLLPSSLLLSSSMVVSTTEPALSMAYRLSNHKHTNVNNHVNTDEEKRLPDKASINSSLPSPPTPITAAIRHMPRGHAWCRDVSGVRAN